MLTAQHLEQKPNQYFVVYFRKYSHCSILCSQDTKLLNNGGRVQQTIYHCGSGNLNCDLWTRQSPSWKRLAVLDVPGVTCCSQWRQTAIQSLDPAFSSRWNTTCLPLDETESLLWDKKQKETLHRFETFCFLNFLFLQSCYATEANHLWQEGRLSLNPDRGGKQSEGHLFSPRTVFPIKPPHGQIQILSSHCKITFQRGTCLTKTIVYFKTALGPLFWPKGWFCFEQKLLAMLPNGLT